MLDLLVKNAIIVTVNSKRDILWNGAIAVQGGAASNNSQDMID
jgi:hypothetical protein